MTTTIIDSTVSPVSSTEKHPVEISPLEEQLPATVPSKPAFNFNAVHNGEACIESLDPKDKGTERQFRFTRALLCTLLGVKSEDTITNHVDKLLKRGVVTETKNLVSVMLPDSLGRECVKTTLYDLTVFNYLVMRLDTDQAWEMKWTQLLMNTTSYVVMPRPPVAQTSSS